MKRSTVKNLFPFLVLSLIFLHSTSVFGQKEAPAVSKLDPAMDVNKKAAADLDWRDDGATARGKRDDLRNFWKLCAASRIH